MRTALIGRYRVPYPYSEHRLDYPVQKALASRMIELHLLLQGSSATGQIWREGNLVVHYAPLGLISRSAPGFVLWAFRRLLEIHRGAPLDVINGSDLWGGLAAILVRRRTGVKVLAQLQGEFLPPSPYSYSWPARVLLHALARFVCRRADAVRCLHRAALERVASLGIPRTRIEVVHTRCDTELFDPRRYPVKQAGGGRLLYAGNLIPGKGVRFLLRAFVQAVKEHPSATLSIAGSGPEEASLRRLSDSLGMTGRITFLGRQRHDALPSLLHETDLFVFPSLSEGTPRAVLEAMAMELPVVAARTGGMADLVEDGRTGHLVPPADAGAFARAITMTLADPTWAREAGREGRRRVVAGYSVQAHVQGMLELHRRLLESPDD